MGAQADNVRRPGPIVDHLLTQLIRHGGLDRLPMYLHPQLENLPGAAEYLGQLGDENGSTIYTGSCHCQAIKFAVKTEPLETAEICDCACSICIGVSLCLFVLHRHAKANNALLQNGVLWLYPLQRNICFHPAKSTSTPYIPAEGFLNEYTFGLGKNGHFICKTCGCQVYEARVVSCSS